MMQREKMIEENLGLVHFVLKKFQGKGHDLEELFQVGCIGLCKAVDGFKESYGLKFSTYAVPVILGEIKRFIRDNTQVHISRSIKETAVQVGRERERLSQLYQREPSIDEIAKGIGKTKEDVMIAIDSIKPADSLDVCVGNEEGTNLKIDQLVSGRRESERAIDQVLCREIFNLLEGKEKHILYMRYFMDLKQHDIAKELCMTQVQVSRMEKRVLARLRKEYFQDD